MAQQPRIIHAVLADAHLQPLLDHLDQFLNQGGMSLDIGHMPIRKGAVDIEGYETDLIVRQVNTASAVHLFHHMLG
ncbi:hypothetical protein D3C71_2184360 [compost metagenome]